MLVLKFFVVLFAEFLFVTKSVQDDNVTDSVTATTLRPIADIWGGMCAKGSMQSPIRLRRSEAIETTRKSFEFDNIENKLSNLELYNNGYGVELLIPFQYKIKIYKGNLDGQYVLTKVQWHWDRSEHDLDDRSSRLETHLLFRNTRYDSWEESLRHGDGIVILAVLHQLAATSTNYISKLTQVISHVTEVKGKAHVTQDITIRELLPYDVDTYYHYKGSLTSPPCLEVVTWIVFTDYLQITNDEIGSFRTVKAEGGGQMNQNYRSIQARNNRNIYYNSFSQGAARSTSPEKIRASFGLISFTAVTVGSQHY